MNILTVDPGCPGKVPTVMATCVHNLRNLFDRKAFIQIIDIPFSYEYSPIKAMRYQYRSRGGKILCPTALYGGLFVNYTPGFAGYQSFLKGLL